MQLYYKFKCFLFWVLLYLFIFFLAYNRPIHQDDGWYASFAIRYFHKFNINNNLSYFSFFDSNAGNDSSLGFLFPLLQLPFFYSLGINILATKIFNSILIVGILYFINKIVNILAPSFQWLIILLFISNPIFYYHFYNRPELLALLLSLISTYFLLKSEKSDVDVFFAFFIWAFIIDVHPIAIFTVIGIGLHYWYFHKKQSFLIITAGISGLVLYLLLSYFLNGTFGLLSPIFTNSIGNYGDHYVPLFKSDLKDYLRIGLERFKTLKSTILLSFIWVLLPIFIYKKYSLKNYLGLVFLNTVVFCILSTIGSEASSNGFALYSIYVFLIFFIIVLEKITYEFGVKYSQKLFFILPLFIYGSFSTFNLLIKYYNYQSDFLKNYYQFASCIKDGSKVLMRPTFLFNMAEKQIFSDYTFGILNVMADNNLKFAEAIKFKKYNYVILDERNLNEELLIDKRDKNMFNNPFYKKYSNIGTTTLAFDSLIKTGFLKPLCELDEMSHGKSVVYQVNY